MADECLRDVGFLKYWTLSNVPLFLIATPMLVVMVCTALMALDARELLGHVKSLQDTRHGIVCLRRFALPQLVLAVLATTNFHVQIINRISSGYPVWYIILALALHGATSKTRWLPRFTQRRLEWIVRAMAMYAIIQGGLYASFMPPA